MAIKFLNTVAVDNDVLYVDASANKVGIGTTSPGVKLTILSTYAAGPTLGSSTVGGQALLGENGLFGQYSGVNSSNGDVWHQVQRNDTATSYNMHLQPAGGNVTMGANVIVANGLLGIGTTTLSNRLSVGGSGQNWDTSPAIKMWDSFNSKGWYVGSANNNTAGDFYIRSVTAEAAYPVAADQQFTIKQSGNVGIGTISPARNVHVHSDTLTDIHLTNTASGQLLTDGGTITLAGTDFLVNNREVGNIRLFTSAAERMRITSVGKVGIKTTNPQDALDVDWDTEGVATDNSGIRVRAYRPHLNLIDRSGYSTSNGHNFQIKADLAKLWFNATSADDETFDLTRMVIDKDGNVGIGTDSPDAKLEVSSTALISGDSRYELLITEDNTASAGRGGGLAFSRQGTIFGGIKTIQNTSNNDNTTMYFQTRGAGTVANRMVIDELGNAAFSGDLTVSGGDITLGGTGRIQGVDTVSASTDAANKAYVDSVVAGIGDITGVTAGTFLTGGGTSGTVILNADASRLAHIVDSSNGSVTSGWITVAQAANSRKAGEIYVTDGESGDHSFIRIDWMRSYADSNFTVLNCGGHANRIQGVRVLQETADPTYGPKYLQIQVTATSNYYVIVTAPGTIPHYGGLVAVTPVLEDTKTGYAVTGAQLEDLQNSSIGTDEGITVGEELYVNGTGNSYFLGNVGIGTDGPDSKLHIADSTNPIFTFERLDTTTIANEVIGQFNFKSTDSSDTGVNASIKVIKQDLPVATVPMAITFETGVSGTVGERMRIDSAGNVGIGTVSPISVLEISQQLSAAETIDYPYTISSRDDNNSINQLGGEGVGIKFRVAGNAATTPGDSLIGASIAAIREMQGDTDSSTGLGFFITQNDETLDEAVRIDHDGKVGIGTTSPGEKLSVDGNIFLQGSDDYIAFNTSASSGHPKIKMNSDADFSFLNTAGSNTFHIENGGNVGIGTLSPDSLLNLEGAKNTSIITLGSTTNDASWSVGDRVGGIDFYSGDGSGSGSGIKASISYEVEAGVTGSTNSMVFRASGTTSGTKNLERMRIDSNGNVGIGITSPSNKLHVHTDTDNDYAIRIEGSTNNAAGVWTGLGIGGESNNTKSAVLFEDVGVSYARGKLHLCVNNELNQNSATPADAKLTVSNNGNVGIGTTSPTAAAKLTVMGNQTFGLPGNGFNASGRFISIEGNAQNNGEASSRVFFTEHNSSTAAMDNYGMSLGYRGGDTSIVGASGNTWTGLTQIGNGEWGMFGHDNNAVGVKIMQGSRTATYTAFYSSGSETMRVTGGNVGIGETIPGAKLDVVGTSSTSSSNLLKIKSTTAFQSAPGHMIDFIRSNNTVRGYIGMNQYGVTYSTSSDYRLKRNIVPIADSIDRIKKLKPSRFNWDDGPDDYVVDGFIAHEVADVIPEAISGEKDDVDKDNAPVYQSIDQSKIVPLLTAALQEAVARIEALELRINKLEKQ